jgi:hypothetical protein
MNSIVGKENGLIRTGGYDEEIMMHESTSREIQMDRYSGSGRPTCPPSREVFAPKRSFYALTVSSVGINLCDVSGVRLRAIP